MGELGNLATALKFGMQLEESNSEYYQKIQKDERVSDIKDLLKKYAEECENQKERLHDLYIDSSRSDMDMGALEPVSGIVEEDYTTEREISQDMTRSDILEIGIEIEEKTSNFYRNMGKKVSFLSEKEMKKTAEEKEEKMKKLRELK